MVIKKFIFAFFIFAFFISGNVFAAGKPILYTASWCGPCSQLKDRLDGKLRDMNGNPIPGVPGWRDHVDIVDTDTLPADAFRPNSIPALYGADGSPIGNPVSYITRQVANQSKPKPPATVPAPKPKPTAGKPPTSPTKPPSIPVPKEQLPNAVFAERMRCSLQKNGVYQCELFNPDGTPVTDAEGNPQKIDVDPNMVGVDPKIAKEAKDLFDAIANSPAGIDFFRNSTTGAIRPLPADGRHLKEPCPNPTVIPPGLSVIPVTPTPLTDTKKYSYEFIRLESLKDDPTSFVMYFRQCELDDKGGKSNCVEKSMPITARYYLPADAEARGRIRDMNASGVPVALPAASLAPIVPAAMPLTIGDRKYVADTPVKSGDSSYAVTVVYCDAGGCSLPITKTVKNPKGATEFERMTAAQSDAIQQVNAEKPKTPSVMTPGAIAPKPLPAVNGSGNLPQPYRRATVTPNAPPPGGAVADPSINDARYEALMKQAEANQKIIDQLNAEAAARKAREAALKKP